MQNDLVQDTLREPFKQRFALLINEFGTALAGNADRLNEAIKLGAPAITQLHKITSILASQNRIITDLNANSDKVIGQLAARRDDVVSFIQRATDTADASLARRADLSRDFEILDDFLAQLQPTLAKLDDVAQTNTPLLADLRAAAPGLNRLALNLPAFSRASDASLTSLGDASTVGTTALRRGADEIRLLAESGKKAPKTGEILADFLRDLDDPARAVEIDDRVPKDTGRDDPRPGQKDTKGYTGLEGLLNYAYYQPGALNQFDQVGHLLHFTLYYIDSGACGQFRLGPRHADRRPGRSLQERRHDHQHPRRRRLRRLARPEPAGHQREPAPAAVRPVGLSGRDGAAGGGGSLQSGRQQRQRQPPSPLRQRRHRDEPASASGGNGGGSGGDTGSGSGGDTGGGTGGGGDVPAQLPNDILDQILNLPPSAIDDLPQSVQDQLGLGSNQSGHSGSGSGQGGAGGATGSATGATGDLLDFLFTTP